ncbi:aspartic protease [Hypericibacter adhaerens]|uniref:Aspartic protease n=1 Tax=Hypericibacter adhaerens TaxID=2602016 RepID=A0A5J6N3E9_9PROT|nr:TIGR02281 family clan AA aspartic protease [Hypericibacter adhaerens]QEX24468.1 aspartic protease [Hypericibacter adhaerens]
MRRPWLLYLIGALGVGLLVFGLAHRFPGALEQEGNLPALAGMLGWLALLGAGCIAMFRLKPRKAIGQMGAWIAILLLLVLGYSFRPEFSAMIATVKARLTGELIPGQAQLQTDGSVVFARANDGHFHVEAQVDGTRIDFLVDTGASGIMLSPADAQRLGFNPTGLDYNVPTSTANGNGQAARVTLGTIEVGQIRRVDMPALVNQADMGGSLLGMKFLDSLGGLSIEGDKLVLRP